MQWKLYPTLNLLQTLITLFRTLVIVEKQGYGSPECSNDLSLKLYPLIGYLWFWLDIFVADRKKKTYLESRTRLLAFPKYDAKKKTNLPPHSRWDIQQRFPCVAGTCPSNVSTVFEKYLDSWHFMFYSHKIFMKLSPYWIIEFGVTWICVTGPCTFMFGSRINYISYFLGKT